jgi:adenine deaminase
MASFHYGNLVDVHPQKSTPLKLSLKGKDYSSKSSGVSRLATDVFILPGFIDSHVHIESSMLVPSSL